MKINPILILLFALISSGAYAACVKPATPSIPDGATASEEELIASNQAVKGYINDTNRYLDCLDQEEVAAGENDTSEAKAARIQDYNSAVDEMEAVANAFNEARAAFLDRSP